MKTSLSKSATPIKIDSRHSRGHLSLVPEAAPVAPVRHYTRAEIRKHRRNVGVIVGAVVLGGGMLLGALVPHSSANSKPKPTPTRDDATTCEIGPGTQKFTFGVGDGKNAAILAIKGSGNGEGDPCWTEAEQAVDSVLHGNEPQYNNKPIEIPIEVHPVHAQVPETQAPHN